jgi:hypothetical protein
MTRTTIALVALAAACVGCRGSGSGGDGASDGASEGSSDASGTGDTADDGGSADCADALPARRLRRLTHVEYDRTIRDLVGLDMSLAAGFAPDNVVDGYDNDADALLVSGLLADQYRAAAEAVADAMLADLATHLPCDAADGASCAEAFLVQFGRRAFRRPVEADELARYAALHGELAADDGFEEALRWTTAAMLQSPAFLYRAELGTPQSDGTYLLTSHELATALSYLVVGTIPDAALDADADADRLHDPEVLLEHAARLLARPDAVMPVRTFVDAWLRTGLLELATRDPDLFPEATADIRAAMRGETSRLVDEVWRGGTLRDLLLADHSYMTDELAAYYGVSPTGDADADGYRRVAVGDRYGGILTHGSVLLTHSLPQSSSPIHRGLVVRERLLCNDLPPPPPGVVNEAPAIEPGVSTRERYQMHSANPSCAACHDLLDPIGFGFEHYDAVGRWRADEAGVAIDASGSIMGAGDPVGFDGTAELAALLAEDPAVHACYAQQWSTFALGGIAQDPGLACMAHSVERELVTADLRLDATIAALVGSRGFSWRRSDDAVPPPPSGDSTGGDPPDPDTAAGDTSTGAPPPPAEGLEVTVVQNGVWAEGECNDVTVTNVSEAAITWEIVLELPGTITTAWNTTYAVEGNLGTFAGVDYNATIEPAASAQFGFCVTY